MSLTLEHVSRVVEGQTWIDDATLVAAQTNSPTGPWVLVTVDVPSGTVVPRTRAEHGSFLAPVAA